MHRLRIDFALHVAAEVLEADSAADKGAEHVRLPSQEAQDLGELVSRAPDRLECELVTAKVRNVDGDAVMATQTDDSAAGENALSLDEALEQRVRPRALDHVGREAAGEAFRFREGSRVLGCELGRPLGGAAECDSRVGTEGHREVAVLLASCHDEHLLLGIARLDDGEHAHGHGARASDHRPHLVRCERRQTFAVFERLIAARQRLGEARQQRVALERLGQDVAPLRRPVEHVCQSAVLGRGPHVAGVRAAVVGADLARVALLAGQPGLDSDDIADAVSPNVLADCNHSRHDFVAKREVVSGTTVSGVNAALVVHLLVRPADAAGEELELDLGVSRVDALELRHLEGLGAGDVPATQRMVVHGISFLHDRLMML